MRCVFLLFQTKPEAMRTVVMSNSSVDLEGNASLRGGSATTTKIARTARTNTTVVSSNSKFIARSCHTLPKLFVSKAATFFRVSVERQLSLESTLHSVLFWGVILANYHKITVFENHSKCLILQHL